MIRLGLIGAGRWGKNYVTAAKQAGNCEVVECTRAMRPVRPYFDGIIIATPPTVTAKIAVDTMHDYHLPVMVEKPVGLSEDDAAAVDAVARETGKICLVNHQHLFAPAYEELYRRTKDLPHIQIATHGGDQKPAHDWPWLWDWAPHDVAMVLDLGGSMEPELASVWEDGESVFCRWRTPKGSAFSHVGVNFRHKHRRCKVNDVGFSAVYDDRAEHKLVIDGQPVEVSPELPLTRSLRAFASAVLAGGTEDRRFGARWGVAVAQQIAAVEAFATRLDSR